ncbi:BASS family bile acid:Na+ symporter [Lewinella aquimaris]|uniref:BASS family bile acid:Na+ symporter n=1 Tax=Neolewinella aquimaris TaxID=1835722 RepID=A0A840E8M4_9BACT|nr:bile acid:sodium symporter family protein [Neolewinella aquimaris]MBB4078418.1 BASS family bile acid:Na+ symporter [Neolewinella aquimaris]
MIDILITIVLALIMFSIGLSLKTVDFRHLFIAPRVLSYGLFLQLMVLPALAFTVVGLADLPPAFSIGFLILSACPGGLSSNFISFLLRANTALAVSLTICNSTVAMFSVPFIINLALEIYQPGTGATHLPMVPTALRLFAIVLLPVLAGMGARHLFPRRSEVIQPHLRRLAMVLLGLVFTLKLLAPASHGGSAFTLTEVGQILPVALLINLLALSTGRIGGALFGLDTNNQITLGVEIGIQNTSLAFLIAGSFLGNDEAIKPALIYAMFTFFTALGYGLLLKPRMYRRIRKDLTGW